MPLTGDYAPGTNEFARSQAELYEATGGREGAELEGRPVIVLTTVGSRSGKLRKTALMRIEHDGEYAVVASKGGAPEHPAWYHNIAGADLVELQDGAVRRDYVPHEATGDERAAWWERAVATWPPFEGYQSRTDRVIPVFVLTPVE